MESKNRMLVRHRPNWLAEWWRSKRAAGENLILFRDWASWLRYGRKSRSEVGVRADIILWGRAQGHPCGGS